MADEDLRAALSPWVSALRYHFHALDSFPGRMKGYERPAPTLEAAVHALVPQVEAAEDRQALISAQTLKLNEKTRNMLDLVIAGHENDAMVALSRLTEAGGALQQGALKSRFEAIDRRYRRQPIGEAPDHWFDYFDAQIRHIDELGELSGDIDALAHPPTPQSVGMGGGGLFRYAMLALVVAACVAGALILYTMRQGGGEEAVLGPAGDSAPRVVRTVPITVTTQPPTREAQACVLALEIADPGAALIDRLDNGAEIARLPTGERVTLRRVIDRPTGERMLEIEASDRGLAGFIAEKGARLPVMEWACDK